MGGRGAPTQGIEVKHEFADAAGAAVLKTAPPVAVATGSALGAIDMTWWVGVVTIGYIVLQGAYLIWKWRRESRKKE